MRRGGKEMSRTLWQRLPLWTIALDYFRWQWLLLLTMRWLRLGGSWKLYVSFVEYCLFYRALLHKRRLIWRSLLIVVTPYRISLSLAVASDRQLLTLFLSHSRARAHTPTLKYTLTYTLTYTLYVYLIHSHMHWYIYLHVLCMSI